MLATNKEHLDGNESSVDENETASLKIKQETFPKEQLGSLLMTLFPFFIIYC